MTKKLPIYWRDQLHQGLRTSASIDSRNDAEGMLEATPFWHAREDESAKHAGMGAPASATSMPTVSLYPELAVVHCPSLRQVQGNSSLKPPTIGAV